MRLGHTLEAIGELAQCAGLLLLQWQIRRLAKYVDATRRYR